MSSIGWNSGYFFSAMTLVRNGCAQGPMWVGAGHDGLGLCDSVGLL